MNSSEEIETLNALVNLLSKRIDNLEMARRLEEESVLKSIRAINQRLTDLENFQVVAIDCLNLFCNGEVREMAIKVTAKEKCSCLFCVQRIKK